MRAWLLVLCAACSKSTGGVDGGPPDGGPWACPSAPPVLGSPCPPPLACEYADVAACSPYFVCTGQDQFTFHWETRNPACPSLRPCTSNELAIEAGSLCSSSGACDDQDGGQCGCRTCSRQGNVLIEWSCLPNAPAGCPPVRPRLGTPCANEGIVCDFRKCFYTLNSGLAVRCLAGLWISTEDSTLACSNPPACP